MKKTKVTLIKGYHGGDGYLHPGQTIEVTSDHAKTLTEGGFIEAAKEEVKEEKKAPQATKEEKITGETK